MLDFSRTVFDATGQSNQLKVRSHISNVLNVANELPIDPYLPEILAAIDKHDIVLVSAATGAGKTTRLSEALIRSGKMLICSQPTRLAVNFIQEHLESRFLSKDGEIIGYRHGLGKMVTEDCDNLICSDGVLLKKIASGEIERLDRESRGKLVVMVDESHLLNLNIEAYFALHRELRFEGRAPKLLITSATMNTSRIVEFFNSNPDPRYSRPKEIPVFEVPGRQYEITDLDPGEESADDAVRLVIEGRGDVLHFFYGIGPIESFITAVEERALELTALPLHGKLPIKQQQAVLKPTDGRRIIGSTNVAETSITPVGVKTVINDGLERASVWRHGEETLTVRPNSQSTYLQRRGRTGRVGPGFFINRGHPFHSLPEAYYEMLNGNLEGLFLTLLVAEKDPLSMRFLNDPSDEKRLETMERLIAQGHIDRNLRPTLKGRFCENLPLAPREAQMIYQIYREQPKNITALEVAIDMAVIADVGDFFTQGWGRSTRYLLESAKIDGTAIRKLCRNSDSFFKLCCLEAVSRELIAEKRLELLELHGIRENAVNEIVLRRNEIAERLAVSISPLGTKTLADIPQELLYGISAAQWSDSIHSYGGLDRSKHPSGVPFYINHDSKVRRYLTRQYDYSPPLVLYGKPLNIQNVDQKNGEIRTKTVLVDVTVPPSTWIKNDEVLNQEFLDASERRKRDVEQSQQLEKDSRKARSKRR